MKLFTIGFTQKSAEYFFETLRTAGVERVVDVRLNNASQLAGFSKKSDLQYFLRVIAGIDYVHAPALAPTQEMLDAYKKRKGAWPAYEQEFIDLMQSRQVESSCREVVAEGSCLLCSEHLPDHCHRRVVTDYLQRHWQDVSVEHLL